MKKSLISLAASLMILIQGYAQQSGLIIRQGHTDPINMVIYTPDGQHILSASDDHSIRMWDVNTGIDIKTFAGHQSGVKCLDITDDGRYLVSGDRSGSVIIWDVAEARAVKTLEAHAGEVNTVKLLPDEKSLISGGSDKVVNQYSFPSGDAIKSISEEITSSVSAVGISPDGTRLLMGGYKSNDVELLLIDLENGVVIDDALKHVKGAGAAKIYTKVILTPVAAVTSIAKGNKVGKDMLTYYTFTYSNIEFSADGSSALISQNLYLPMTAEKGKEDEIGGTTVAIVEFTDDRNSFKNVTKPQQWRINHSNTRAIFNKDQTRILANLKNSIKIFDMANANFPESGQEASEYEPPVLQEFQGSNSFLTSIAIAPDYRTVAASSEDRGIQLWDVETGRSIRTLEGYVQPALAVEALPDGRHILVGSHNKNMTMWDITTGRLVKSFDRASDVNHIDVSDDGRFAVTTAENTKFIKIWNLKNGRLKASLLEKEEDIVWAKFEDSEYVLAATETGKLKRWSISEKKIKKKLSENYLDLEDKFDDGSYQASFDGLTVILSENGSTVLEDKQSGIVTDAVFSRDHRYLITTNTLGEICLYNVAEKKKVASMALIDDFEYITFTPDYYYTSSKGASKAIAFRSGDELLPFEQMEVIYNRPDVIADRLGYASRNLIESYKAAYQKRIDRLGFESGSLAKTEMLPEVDIDLGKIPLATSSRSLSFEISATDNSAVIQRLFVYVNDVPLGSSDGTDLSTESSASILKTIDLELSNGLNEIKVVAMNASGVSSLPSTFQVNYEGEYYKPRLFLLGIGISDYMNGNDLTFAAKDANDLAMLLENSTAFSEVHTKLITNNEGTKENILGARDFLSQAGVDDLVLVFIAGHGLVDNNSYYFATHDIDWKNASERGLSYDELISLLDGLPSRKKLLLMDTCHSGELDPDEMEEANEQVSKRGAVTFRATGKIVKLKENSFGLRNTLELSKTLFGDLNKGTGATVISAAGGTEYALEGVNSSNGLFTSCFLTGIRQRRADLNRDREYTVSELRQYITEQVIRLSDGSQVPTSREENVKNDFRIY